MTMTALILEHARRDLMVARLIALCTPPQVRCLYFGCIGTPSHGLWRRKGRVPLFAGRSDERELDALFGGIDAILCPPGPQTEGLARLIVRGNWTAIAFWDRSVDPRLNSNSAFFIAGTVSFGQALRIARCQWPEVWSRFSFEVRQAPDEQGERT